MKVRTFEIDIKPVPQGRSRHTRRGRVYYGKRDRAFRLEMVSKLRQYGGKAQRKPCAVEIEVAGANPRSDLDNHAKAIMDALVEAGILAEDNIEVVERLTVEAVEGPAGIKVTLLPLVA